MRFDDAVSSGTKRNTFFSSQQWGRVWEWVGFRLPSEKEQRYALVVQYISVTFMDEGVLDWAYVDVDSL